MKPKNYKTKPFRYTYKVYDQYDGVCIFKTTDLIEAYGVLNEHRHETVVVSQYSHNCYLYEHGHYLYNHRHPLFSWESIVPRYQLWDHFGKEVPYSRYRAAYRRRYPRYRPHKWRGGYWNGFGDQRDTLVIHFKKNDPNKIKKGYFHVFVHNNWDNQRDYYDFKIGGWYRAIRTTNERRQTSGHVDEYGESIVRGRRRGKTLPNSWDDFQNHSADSTSSWKHNSRRRHQWKVK